VSEGEKKNPLADRPELSRPDRRRPAKRLVRRGHRREIPILVDAPLGRNSGSAGRHRPPLYVRSLERQISWVGKVMEEAPDDFHPMIAEFLKYQGIGETNGLLLVAEARIFPALLSRTSGRINAPDLLFGRRIAAVRRRHADNKKSDRRAILPPCRSRGDFIRFASIRSACPALGSKAGGNAKLTDANEGTRTWDIYKFSFSFIFSNAPKQYYALWIMHPKTSTNVLTMVTGNLHSPDI
jgi:hypothetical protein